MSWWQILAFGYLASCWVASIVVLNFNCDAEDSELDADSARAAQKSPLAMRIGEGLAVFLIGPFLPLVAIYCLVAAWRERRAWRAFSRVHREVVCEPMHLVNMPAAAAEHIEWHETLLAELGFDPVGSFLLKPEPLPIYSKCFISADGETVADVSLIGNQAAHSFSSILENGHVLETACLDSASDTERINESGLFTANMVQRDSLTDGTRELYRRHRETLGELEQQFDCRTLHFDCGQVTSVMGYANEVFGEVKFTLGELDAPPLPAVCPTGVARRATVAADSTLEPLVCG